MKIRVLVATLVLFGMLCVCEANPIVTRLERDKLYNYSNSNPSGLDYPTLLLSLASIIAIESVILLRMLGDFRVLLVCPYANAVSTLPGFFLIRVTGLNESAHALTQVCIIMACFLVSVLIESGIIVALIKKLPLRNILNSIFFANAVTYLIILASVWLGFFKLYI